MTRISLLTLLACLIVFAAPLSAQQGDAPFLVEETGQGFSRLSEAVDSIGSGTGTILIAPGRYRQCAVQEAGRITFRAREPGSAILDGVACEGKASLVLGGEYAAVDGIVFQNVRVPDANGAGIRLEAGDLLVRESLFRSGENGILVANDHDGRIRIEQSTFSALGACPEDQGCSHAIYNSGSGSLSIHRARFERGTGGHYVKSRGEEIEVVDSSFDDSQGRASNYMIDLSNGATGLIARNLFVQGENKENYSAFIMVAAEGAEHRSGGLTISDNEASLAPGVDRNTAFVADSSGEEIRITGNRLGNGLREFEAR